MKNFQLLVFIPSLTFLAGRMVIVTWTATAQASSGLPGPAAPLSVQRVPGPVEKARESRQGFAELPSTGGGDVTTRTK